MAPLDHTDQHQEVCGNPEQYGGNESACSGTRDESVCTLPVLKSLSACRLNDNVFPLDSTAAGSATQYCIVQSISGTIWVHCHKKEESSPSTANSDMVPKFLKKSRFLRVKPASRQRHHRGQRAAHGTASAALVAVSSQWLRCMRMSDWGACASARLTCCKDDWW